MIRTPICNMLGIEHPIALGGMGSATSPALVAAVSRAGVNSSSGSPYNASTSAIDRDLDGLLRRLDTRQPQ